MTGYDQDLAAIHDAGWLGVAEAGAHALVSILGGKGRAAGVVVELGCGSGASSRVLADSGFDVVGIDASPAMIDIARRRVPEADFRVSSFVDHEIPPCEAVTAFGEVLNYLFDERNSAEALGNVFARVHEALRPRGIFIFDVAGPGRGSGRIWHAGEDWAILVDAGEADGVITRRMITFRVVDGAWRRGEEVHRQAVFTSPEIAALLRKAGFGVRVVRSYGEHAFAPHVRGFVATKH